MEAAAIRGRTPNLTWASHFPFTGEALGFAVIGRAQTSGQTVPFPESLYLERAGCSCGREVKPHMRLHRALRHAFTPGIHAAEAELRGRVPLPRHQSTASPLF